MSSGVATSTGCLVDQWGRPHALASKTLIGREPGTCGVAVLQGSISRRHAQIEHDADADEWTIRDLGSTNGTVVAGERIDGDQPLIGPCEVFVGDVGFFFVDSDEPLSGPADASIKITARSPLEESGLPRIAMRLVEPTGGGGGLVELDGASVQLTATQFELIALLARRMLDESEQADAVRGFVRSSELAAQLPWDTPHPEDNHVKQLVRRVRRTLARAGVSDLIESRRRFGYRLRAIPTLDR